MTKSDEFRAKAEQCRLMAAKVTTPIDQAAWLELATDWLGLIPEPAQTASDRFDATERDRGTRQLRSSAEHQPPTCPPLRKNWRQGTRGSTSGAPGLEYSDDQAGSIREARLIHSPPTRAPFSATERFISSTTGTSMSITAADSQKISK